MTVMTLMLISYDLFLNKFLTLVTVVNKELWDLHDNTFLQYGLQTLSDPLWMIQMTSLGWFWSIWNTGYVCLTCATNTVIDSSTAAKTVHSG